MKVQITFETRNAAFADNFMRETERVLARALEIIAGEHERGVRAYEGTEFVPRAGPLRRVSRPLYDTNGNKVGVVHMRGEKEEE